MRTIGLTTLVAFGLVTPAMAAATVPEEYQGVWAAARDCKENFQNVLSNVVNREFAAMTAISLAVAAGGAIKSSRTTPLMTGAQAVEAMKKVADVASIYRPAT